MQDDKAMSFRLSPQQEQLWTTQLEGPAASSRVAILLEGLLDPDGLRDALHRVVGRHEILRTTFRHQAGMRAPLQVVRDALAPSWDVSDLGAHDAEEQASEFGRMLMVEQEPWNYYDGPLVRAQLVTLAPDRHVLVLTVAAVCADSGSMATVLRELALLYEGEG